MSGDADRFDKRGNFVGLWKIRAKELYDSVQLLWRGSTKRLEADDGSTTEIVELYRPAQLLMGLCLEVALKGLIVKHNPDLVSGGKIDKKMTTHSIEKLSALACISIERSNEAEINLIRKLSDAVEWVSKYPIPLNASQLKSPKHGSSKTLIRRDDDIEIFEELWRRIDIEYNRT